MFELEYRASFAGDALAHWAGLTALQAVGMADETWLVAGSAATGGYRGFALTAGRAAHLQSVTALVAAAGGVPGAGFRLSDVCVLSAFGQTRLLASARDSGWLDAEQVSHGGLARQAPMLAGSAGQGIAALVTFEAGGQSFVATAAQRGGTVALFRLDQNWHLSQTAALADDAKTMLAGTTDLEVVRAGGKTYLAAASSLKDGISLLEVDGAGTLRLSDAISAGDGLWVAGVDQIRALAVAGTAFLVAASVRASSLAVVRINDLGVMFASDTLADDAETRIGHVGAMAVFSQAGRGFVLAGGSDGGLSLFELLPDGQLHLHQSVELQTGWTTGPVAAVSVVPVGAEMQVFYSTTSHPGLTQLTLDLRDLAPMQAGGAAADRLTGGPGQDLLIGGGGDDSLSGGAGDDLLIAGAGANRLTGGAGADEFVFTASSGAQSVISDFEAGTDRINLDGWGRIYDFSALTITPRSYGADVIWQGEQLRVETANHHSLTAGDLTAADFLF